MLSLRVSLALLSTWIITGLSAPAPQVTSPVGANIHNGVCTPLAENYTITSQKEVLAPPRLVTGSTCEATESGCSISDGKTYAVDVTFTGGLSGTADLTKVISVGITGSVSVGITKSEAISTTIQCPKSCDCGLQAVAHLWHIEGVHNTVHIGNELPRGPMCPEEQNVATPYTADVPILIPGAAQDNQAVVDFSACRVPHTFCGPWGPPDKQWLPLCPSL